MNASADPVTIALTGMWPFIMISSAVLTFPASALLLGVYRRAVVRGMNASRAGSIPSAPATARSAAPAMPLRFVSLNANAASPSHLPGPWHAAAVYLAAGAAYALTMTAAWLLATRDHQIGPIKVIFIFWSYYWPAMLAVVLVAAEDRARKASVVLGYFAAYVALTVVELTLSPEFTWKQAAGFWIIQNAPATVLLYLFLMRRIRSVGPLVLVFAIVALLGSELAISFLGASDARMSTAVEIGSAIGLGGIGVFVATLLLGFLVFALLGWMVLRWIGARYAAKKLSDESLTADAIFLIFAINASIGLVFQHWMWIAAALVGFAAYKAIAQIGFRLIPKTSSPKRLLLLRVFALGARSEPLFDVVRKQWLRGGSIAMIAGPDLVTSAVQPHEFLGFLESNLHRRRRQPQETRRGHRSTIGSRRPISRHRVLLPRRHMAADHAPARRR